MCDLTMGLTAGLSLIKGGADFFMQGDRARKNTDAAHNDFMLSMAMTAQRMQQARKAAATKVYFNNREANATVATTTTRASEMGVTGNTISQLVGDLEAQNALRNSIIHENSDNEVNQLFAGVAGAKAQMDERINSVPQPSLAPILLGVADSVIGGMTKQAKRGQNPLTNLLDFGE